MRLKGKHLIEIEPMDSADLGLILDTAETFLEVMERPIKKVPTLRGKLLVNLFFENSTRTRSSFEIAQKILSADSLNFSASSSSLSKGETLIDTALTLQAMNPNLIVMRHAVPGACHKLSEYLPVPIVNAGDGAHEHPTQALLDAFTIRRRLGRLDGLKVSIVGDILHSRVVRSNIYLLHKMGAKVMLCGPRTFMPRGIETLPVTVTHNLDEAVDGADVIMMLRIQLERQGRSLYPSLEEYHDEYGLTLKRLKGAKKDAIVMHPGPMNRGVEIASEVADGPRSVILDQVKHGVAVRMAVIYLLLGGEHESAN